MTDDIVQQIADMQREIRALKSLGSTGEVLSYLTGATGSAQATNDYTLAATSVNTASSLQWQDYDPDIDPSVDIIAPASGKLRVQIFSWAYIGVNIVASSGAGLNARFAADVAVVDGDGNVSTDYIARAQAHLEIWGTNNSYVMGLNSSDLGLVTGLTPGANYTIRGRHGYYGYAHNGSGNTISMPSGSWFKGTIGPMSINVVPQ